MSGTGRGVADDWQLNKSMLECSTQLFLNSHLSDVDFVFPSEEPPVSLHAHKFVLALRSPVFEVMFYGSLPAKDSVTILDNSSAAFRSLLKFIYTDRSELENCQNAIETMQAAHKYRIPLLAEISASFLENSITPGNVCAVLHEALVYDLKKLQFKCQQVIDNSASDVLRSEAFLECSEACLECILSSDNLNVEEIRIYNAVKLWAEGECGRQDLEPSGQNMRQVLGKAFFHLRLLYIPLELFSDLISQDGILTEGEVIQIFRYHTSASPENPDFVNCSRRKLKHVVMSRMQDGPKSNNAGKAWRSETIKFSVSEPVRLMSIGLLNLIIKTDIGDEYMGNNHMLSLDLTDLHVNSTGSDSDDDFLERQLRYGSSSHEFGVRSCSFAFKSREIECVNADLPKPIDLISDRWYRLDVNFYSSNRAVLNTELKGKNFYQLMGSANKSKVTSESGLKAVFQGASHGPIHSLCLLPKPKNDQ